AGSPDDYLGLATQSAPLLAADGKVVFQTNLGVVATLDPRDGSFIWATRYRGIPATSQKRIIRDDLRFSLTPPRRAGSLVLTAPQDSPYVHAFDLATGAEAWRFPRDRARDVAGLARGRLILSGPRPLLAVDA